MKCRAPSRQEADHPPRSKTSWWPRKKTNPVRPANRHSSLISSQQLGRRREHFGRHNLRIQSTKHACRTRTNTAHQEQHRTHWHQQLDLGAGPLHFPTNGAIQWRLFGAIGGVILLPLFGSLALGRPSVNGCNLVLQRGVDHPMPLQ